MKIKKLREKHLSKLIALVLGLMMPVWGYLNYTTSVYGQAGQILGIIQIIIGITFIVGVIVLK